MSVQVLVRELERFYSSPKCLISLVVANLDTIFNRVAELDVN